MGKHVSGGGRTVSARSVAGMNTDQDTYDIARATLRGMSRVRITTIGTNTVSVQVSEKTSQQSITSMRSVEERLRSNFQRISDSQEIEPFGTNRFRWISEFRRR